MLGGLVRRLEGEAAAMEMQANWAWSSSSSRCRGSRLECCGCAVWGDCPDPPDPCPADFDDDEVVGVLDFLLLLANWTT